MPRPNPSGTGSLQPCALTKPSPPSAAASGGRAGVIQPFGLGEGKVASDNKHGHAAATAEAEARKFLDSVDLATDLTPALLDKVHTLSYSPDEKYNSASAYLSPGYWLARLRGKLKVGPAERRKGWAAAPESYYMRTYTWQEIQNVKSYGADFVGYYYENNQPLDDLVRRATGQGKSDLPPYWGAFGKTIFRPASGIDQDLKTLCADIRKELKGKGKIKTSKKPLRDDSGYLIAARFKQRFIAIHPYMDGNGRVSRLIAERILKEYGLEKPKWTSSKYDLNMSVKEIATNIEFGA